MEQAFERDHGGAGGNGTGSKLSGLRALILLGGSVRRTPLISATGRSLLDLPVDEERSILLHWCGLAADLVAYLGQPSLDVRLLVDRKGPCPAGPPGRGGLHLTIERDPLELRGTGGMLRDVAGDYGPDDLILVVNATKIPLGSLRDEVRALERMDGDVRIVAQADGTPTGMMLLRCGALRLVPDVGFVDMKEQALPAIAERMPVVVIRHDRPVGEPIRSLPDYVAALRAYHRHLRQEDAEDDPFTEVWEPAFGIVEDGVELDGSVRVHDSVVLRGGAVGPGATLVRSVVCPGGRLPRGGRAIGELVVPRAEVKRLKTRVSGVW